MQINACNTNGKDVMTRPNFYRIKHILAAAIFLLYTNLGYAAGQLIASVDRDNIGIQETFTLTISAESRSSGQPDVATLKNDFEILSNNVSQFTSITNAGAEYKKVWQLTLAPKRVGTLLIPSFNVDGAISDAIEITVSKQAKPQANSDDPVQVSVEVSKNDVFVQEQILVKFKITSKVNINQTELQPLEIKNAVVIPLNEKPKRYLSTIKGVQHLIEEQNFAVFPQESGKLVIPGLIYSVVPNVERDFWNDPFGRNRSNLLRLPTEEQSITVKPALAAAGKPWQPANNLTLNESWSTGLDHLKVGEPVTRTIVISAEGLTGGQISPLTNEPVDGLTFYPDQPQNSDAKTDKGIQGTRVETMAIIPNHGGEFILPEIKVEWWDNKSQAMQTASLPAKKINVLGAAAPTPTASIGSEANPTTGSVPNATPTTATVNTNTWLWVSTCVFAILAIALGFYVVSLKAAIKTLRDEQDEAKEIISEKEKHIWDLLKHSAAANDVPTLRKAILQWARFQWPQASIHALDDVAKLASNSELTQHLKTLDELLYSNHSVQEWDANNLLQLLNECRKEKNRKKKSEGLQPLYKH